MKYIKTGILKNKKLPILTFVVFSTFYFLFSTFSTHAQTTIADVIYAIPPQFSKVVGNGALNEVAVKDITQNKATIVGKYTQFTPTFVIYLDTKTPGVFDDKCYPSVRTDRTFTCNLIGLVPARTYHYIAVSSIDDKTRLSTMNVFATLPVSANLYVHKLDHQSAEIQAVISDGAKNPSIIYGEIFGKLANPIPMKLANGIYTAAIPNLKSNTYYYYVLQGDAYDNSGRKLAYSSVLGFTTLPTPPTAVVDNASTIVSSSVSTVPSFTLFDSSSLVKCGLKGQRSDNPLGEPLLASGKQACGFPELLGMVNDIINLLLFLIAPTVFVIIMLYGGWLILISAGSTENVTKARGMMTKAVGGLVIALLAWLLIKTILVSLGVDTTIFPVFYS